VVGAGEDKSSDVCRQTCIEDVCRAHNVDICNPPWIGLARNSGKVHNCVAADHSFAHLLAVRDIADEAVSILTRREGAQL
jgi:hypothetical protein